MEAGDRRYLNSISHTIDIPQKHISSNVFRLSSKVFKLIECIFEIFGRLEDKVPFSSLVCEIFFKFLTNCERS